MAWHHPGRPEKHGTILARAFLVTLIIGLCVGAALLARTALKVEPRAAPDAARPPQVQSGAGALRDSLNYSDSDTLREKLITSCFGTLDSIKKKHPGNILLGINCDLAKERAVQDYGKTDASPLMLGAWLLEPNGDGPVLMVCALDVKRETDRLLLVASMPGGGLMRVVYHFDMAWKDASLVVHRVKRVRKAALEEIQKLGNVKRSPLGVEVHIDAGPEPLPIPDTSLIGAAVEDRNGRISNFVEVSTER